MRDGEGTEHGDQSTRRSRRRHRASSQQAPVPADPRETAPPGERPGSRPDQPGATTPSRKPTSHRHRADGAERGMRDLVGAGPSQLGVSRALRGRDADRPTPEELARAEEEIVLVRRHWTPGPS